jgi:NADPH-dependent ferric siderophore reductase
METSILQQIKDKAGKYFGPQLLQTGQVLDVRVWEPATMIEIDLHLPLADMRLWNEIPYIKFKVDESCFRDYTPFGWDAETATCSLLVDTTHEGCGSRWAAQLHAGDTVQYIKIGDTHQSPHPTNLVVGLGDASSVGHLLALQQLTLPGIRFDGAVLLDSPHTGQLVRDYFRSPVSTLTTRHELANWLLKQGYCTAHTSFYLTGNRELVVELRTLLKNLGHVNIQAKKFWS